MRRDVPPQLRGDDLHLQSGHLRPQVQKALQGRCVDLKRGRKLQGQLSVCLKTVSLNT